MLSDASKEFEFIDKLPDRVVIKGYSMTNTVYVGDRKLDLESSLKVRNHSPTGFNWGYGGSGPAQFALAILLKYLTEEQALSLYQDFKFKYIGTLPKTDFVAICKLKEIIIEILTERVQNEI